MIGMSGANASLFLLRAINSIVMQNNLKILSKIKRVSRYIIEKNLSK
jgi:hypothetical protein